MRSTGRALKSQRSLRGFILSSKTINFWVPARDLSSLAPRYRSRSVLYRCALRAALNAKLYDQFSEDQVEVRSSASTLRIDSELYDQILSCKPAWASKQTHVSLLISQGVALLLEH